MKKELQSRLRKKIAEKEHICTISIQPTATRLHINFLALLISIFIQQFNEIFISIFIIIIVITIIKYGTISLFFSLPSNP